MFSDPLPICCLCLERTNDLWEAKNYAEAITRAREAIKISVYPPTVLACNLNAISEGDLPRYTDLFTRIQAAITDRSELADGYVFRLNGESLSLMDVAQWVSLERLCCPFFVFQLQTTGGEPDYWLTLQGPDGAKAIIDQEFAAGARRTSTHSSE